MKEQIEKLEAQLKELKEVYEKEQRIKYESQIHVHFDEGDIVTNGKDIGIVGWTENKVCNCPYESGYMGVSLITGSRGFLGFTKRDEWKKVDDEYFRSTFNIELALTGLEIEDLKYYIGSRNVNPNQSKTKLLDILDSIHK